MSGGPALLSSGSADFDVGYLVAVDVPLPLFDRARGERARARAARSAFDAERQVVTLTWQAEHRAALARADDARRRRQAHDQTLARVQQLAHSAARDLAVGSGDVVAFVDAVRLRRELALVTVELDEALARAAIDLTYFAGTDVPAQEQP